MAKSNPFTLEDLEKKGYVRQEDGTYAKSVSDYEKAITTIKDSLRRSPAQIIAKQPVSKSDEFELNKPIESFLTIHGIVAGLNSSNGLMRSHWSVIKKQKDIYRQIIKDQLKEGKIRKHEGKVKVTYIGYKSNFMDWDNFAASFKLIGDSLTKEKIIIDDNPKVVVEFIPKQIKCKRKDQMVIVIIQDV